MGTISERIRELRTSRGMTQKVLADKLGIERSTISKWEKPEGGSEPDTNTIVRLARIFNVSTDYLLGHSDTATGNDIDLDKLDETDLTIAAMRPDMMEGYQDLEPEAKELLRDIIRNFYKRFGKKES